MIDTHTHLNDRKFESDLREVIARALDAGVERVVVCGYDMPSNRRAVEIAAEHDCAWATVGVHPHDAKSLKEGDLRELVELSGAGRVTAIGEIGLDYHYDFSPRADQIAAFEMQLTLAGEAGLPVVVHSREAHADTVAVMKSARAIKGCVFHCFSGDAGEAREVLDMGFYIGVDGPVTYSKSDKLREVVLACPLERILIETDCPYMSPAPHRGKRNEPAYLPFVCDEIARIKGIDLREADEMTSANARRLFGMDQC